VSRFEPPVSPTSEPFWEASRSRQLLVQWCVDCDAPIFYPRDICPRCLGDRLEWRPSAGRGAVYTFTVDGPTMVALVDVDEGFRMMSNIVGCDADQLAVGMPVQVTWEPLSDGRHLPLFEPRS
jgi:uncharacterized OB-fold protein